MVKAPYFLTETHGLDPAQFLRIHYGFDCGCAGCQRPRSERLQSLERVKAFNRFSQELLARMQANSGHAPLDILDDIQRNLLTIWAEGYVWEIGRSGHDAFQLCAFYGDGKSAVQWEVMAREVNRVAHGMDHEIYQKSAKLVIRPTSFRQWKALVRPGGKALRLRGPSQEVLACFKRAVFGSSAPNVPTPIVRNPRHECQIENWKEGHKAICGNAVKYLFGPGFDPFQMLTLSYPMLSVVPAEKE
ncbi:hypothetical protein C8F01DRAFT_1285076 [Mycena amicta]|nr:hypothetical protein C8F01DRAFT_1285076 [Mycena amicta]